MTTYKALKGKKVKFFTSDPPAAVAEGQVWYNNSAQDYKTSITSEAWAAGGNMNTGRKNLSGTGTQTAGLIFGGTAPPFSALTEEYDGSSWTESGDLNTARDSGYPFGTQTAAVMAAGFGGPPNGFKNPTEEYNGSAWANGNNVPGPRAQGGGSGTLTAGLIFGGNGGSPETAQTSSQEYDGTNWTAAPGLNTADRYISGCGATVPATLKIGGENDSDGCLLYTSPSPRD